MSMTSLRLTSKLKWVIAHIRSSHVNQLRAALLLVLMHSILAPVLSAHPADCPDGRLISTLTPAPPGPPLEDGPIANVTDFGAIGDGDHDDTHAINCAIDAINDGGEGGTVFFPEGTYKVSRTDEFAARFVCLSLHSHIDYRGMGKSSTIKMAAEQRPSTRMLSNQRIHGVTGIRIMFLDFDGNRWEQNPGNDQHHGVFIAGATDVTIENSSIHDFVGDGVYAYVQSLPGSSAWNPSRDIKVRNNEFYYINRVAINFGEATDSTAENNYIHNAPGHCFKIEVSNGITEGPARLIQNNEFRGNKCIKSTGIALEPRQGYCLVGTKIVGNYFEDTLFYPVHLHKLRNRSSSSACPSDGEVAQTLVSKNVFFKNDLGIRVNESSDVTIEHNEFIKGGDPFNVPINVGRFSVQGDSAAIRIDNSDNFTIRENRIKSSNQHGIYLNTSHAGSILRNQIGNTGNPLWALGLLPELNKSNSIRFGPKGVFTNGLRLRNSSDIRIEHNSITGTRGSGIVLLGNQTSDNTFRRNRLYDSYFGGVWISQRVGAGNDFGSDADLGLNCFDYHSRGNDNFGLKNESSNTISARHNWWGCIEGPEVSATCTTLTDSRSTTSRRSPIAVESGAGDVDFSNYCDTCPLALDAECHSPGR